MQRRTEAARNAADKDRPSGEEDDEPRRGDEQDEDDTGDSKETRLTLMEEVLLLGLKDREVKADRNVLLDHKMKIKFNVRRWEVIQADVSYNVLIDIAHVSWRPWLLKCQTNRRMFSSFDQSCLALCCCGSMVYM